MNLGEKIEVAKQLELMKVDVIEAGFAISSPGDFESVQSIAKAVKDCSVASLARSTVKDIDAAVARLKTCAAPANTVRLHCDTPCAKNGTCAGLNGGMTAGCNTDARICCNYVVSARQRHKDRIQIILVGEPLGF